MHDTEEGLGLRCLQLLPRLLVRAPLEEKRNFQDVSPLMCEWCSTGARGTPSKAYWTLSNFKPTA